MRIPKESLDDFIADARKPAEPPVARSLRPTGTVNSLKPLTTPEDLAKSKADASVSWVRRLSWPYRWLGVMGGLAIVIFLGSSIYIAFYGPSAEPTGTNDLGINRQRKGPLPPKEPGLFPRLQLESSPPVIEDVYADAPVVRARRVKPHVQIAANRQRRLANQSQHFVMSKFVPTTLVIYAENGTIKTRIEPQLTAGYKKPPALPN